MLAAKRQRIDASDHIQDAINDTATPEGFDDGISGSLEADGVALLSDTMAAVMLLRNRFPPSAKTSALILRSQLYTLVKDRTTVERDLERHRDEGIIRMIKLPASVDDYGYILSEDYRSCIETARLSMQESKGCLESDLNIFPRFLERVIPHCKESTITHSQLLSLLSKPVSSHVHVTTDKQISLLLGAGLLTRQVGGHSNSYLFALAGGGKLVTSITKGRKDIVAALGRKRYKEAPLKEVLTWQPKGSCLDMQWHVSDLIGRGSVSQVDTPSGPYIRLERKER